MRTLGWIGLLCLLAGCRADRLTLVGEDFDASVTFLPDSGRGDAGADAGTDAGEASPDAGDAGPADAGADGGTDAGVPFDLERAVRACERWEACVRGPDGNGPSSAFLNVCIQWLGSPTASWAQFELQTRDRLSSKILLSEWVLYFGWLQHPDVQTCLLGANVCEDVLACFNRGAPAAPCTASATSKSCVGGVLNACARPSYDYAMAYPATGYRTFSYDCGAEGKICAQAPGNAGQWACASGTCTDAPRCEGNVAVRCFNGFRDTVPCGSELLCRTTSGMGLGVDALCSGTGATCNTPADQGHCDGDKLVSCGFHYLATTSCPQGLSCHTAPNGFGFCGVAAECSPTADAPSCDSGTGVLRVCALGKWSNVDCHALGFAAGCVAGQGTQPAMCRN